MQLFLNSFFTILFKPHEDSNLSQSSRLRPVVLQLSVTVLKQGE
jgi:hypothetical protein